MRAIQISATRLVLAAVLVVGGAVGLSKPAHADKGHGWGAVEHGHGGHRDFGRRNIDMHSRHGHFDYGHGPRHHAYAPPVRFQSYSGPSFHGSIVFRSAPERLVLAAPVLPAPRIILPPVPYGVTELGPAR